jgi:hypothetical protein
VNLPRLINIGHAQPDRAVHHSRRWLSTMETWKVRLALFSCSEGIGDA